MRIILLSILAAALQAQTISIDIGSASENFCSGSKWGSAQQASRGSQPPPFSTLRYGA